MGKIVKKVTKCDNPGHNILEDLPTNCNGKKFVGFLSDSPRFRQVKDCTLGPGVYDVRPKRTCGCKRGAFHKPHRQPRENQNHCGLPPNVYASFLTQHTIESFVQRKLTEKGPFRIFTGPRDESTFIGYFKKKKPIETSNYWPPSPPKLFDCLRHPYVGKFSPPPPLPKKIHPIKRNQVSENVVKQIKKRIKTAHSLLVVNWQDSSKIKQNKYPFNSSMKYRTMSKKHHLSPEPAQYYIPSTLSLKNGHTSVFKSKTTVGLQLPKGYSIYD